MRISNTYKDKEPFFKIQKELIQINKKKKNGQERVGHAQKSKWQINTSKPA